MKRFLLPLVALSIALTSCNRDNDDVINNPITNPVEQPMLITQIDFTDNFSSLKGTFSFSYDGDKIKESLLKTEDGILNEHIYYTYTDDKITSIKYTNSFEENEIFFTYNTDGTLKSSTSGNIVSTYTYNADNSVIVNYQVNGSNKTTAHIKNGNLVELQSPEGIHTITYDTQHNPFKNIKGLTDIGLDLYLISSFGAYEHTFYYFGAFTNNIMTISEPNGNKQFTYEYNSSGFPIKGTELHTGPDYNQYDITLIRTFHYNNK